jgi:hypothetical protein
MSEEITLCPEVARYMDEHNNEIDMEWLGEHLRSCSHCQEVKRLIDEVTDNWRV